MTIKEYTLSDAEDKLNHIAAISMFLNSGACPTEILFNLYDHMHDEIENLQGILSFMRLYPEIKAQELEASSRESA
ncbi:TPA: RstC protein [Vibrio parahaemolyticus]|uniref:RstC protein n=1 Tax=Vibrio parahaemolyticus TaxID=670 RepID=UPI003B67D2A2